MAVGGVEGAPRIILVNTHPIGEQIVQFSKVDQATSVIGYDPKTNKKSTTPAPTIQAVITGRSRPTAPTPGMFEQAGPKVEKPSVIVEPHKGKFVDTNR